MFCIALYHMLSSSQVDSRHVAPRQWRHLQVSTLVILNCTRRITTRVLLTLPLFCVYMCVCMYVFMYVCENRPSQQDTFFCPQRPYCTQGSLREQIMYPATPADRYMHVRATYQNLRQLYFQMLRMLCTSVSGADAGATTAAIAFHRTDVRCCNTYC
jgi:hypothetical protein